MIMRGIWVAIAVAGLLLAGCAKKSRVDGESEKYCRSFQEYQASLKYLQDRAEVLSVTGKRAAGLAFEISKGCTHSAQRFVRITEMLSVAGMTTGDAVEFGLKYAKATDAEAHSFIAIFKRAFLGKYLDLDIRGAANMAKELSLGFDKTAMAVEHDFDRVSSFCLEDEVQLPGPQCSRFAAEVAQRGQTYPRGASGDFIRLYRFLRSESGPELSIVPAMNLSLELVKISPEAADTFMRSYRFAMDKNGLSMEKGADAIEFGKKLSKLTLYKEKRIQ